MNKQKFVLWKFVIGVVIGVDSLINLSVVAVNNPADVNGVYFAALGIGGVATAVGWTEKKNGFTGNTRERGPIIRGYARGFSWTFFGLLVLTLLFPW